MAKSAATLTDVQERTWTQSVGTALTGMAIMVVAVLIWYATKYFGFPPPLLLATRLALGVAIFAGAALLGLAILRSLEIGKKAGIPYSCPYCDKVNALIAEPTLDFDCGYCNRTIHFIDGEPAPVRTIECQICHAEHRVPVTASRFTCDRCNRPLQLETERPQAAAERIAQEEAASQVPYNVVLIAYDRRKEGELAFKLQNLMVINLPEAKRLMAAATAQEPLIVAYNQAQRKAEFIRRELQDLGATAALRAVSAPKASGRF